MALSFHLPHRTGEPPHSHHSAFSFSKVEGAADVLIVAGIVLFIGAMIFGLLTTTGSAPWY